MTSTIFLRLCSSTSFKLPYRSLRDVRHPTTKHLLSFASAHTTHAHYHIPTRSSKSSKKLQEAPRKRLNLNQHLVGMDTRLRAHLYSSTPPFPLYMLLVMFLSHNSLCNIPMVCHTGHGILFRARDKPIKRP